MPPAMAAPSCMWGKAAVAMTGLSSTSHSRKNADQTRRSFIRRSFRISQSRCAMPVARAMTASAPVSAGSRVFNRSRFAARIALVIRALQAESSACRYRWNASNGSSSGRAVRLTVAPACSRWSAMASMAATVSGSVACPGWCDQTATRRVFRLTLRGGGRLYVSPVSSGSGRASRSSARARSSADRAIGPDTAISVGDAGLVSGSP